MNTIYEFMDFLVYKMSWKSWLAIFFIILYGIIVLRCNSNLQNYPDYDNDDDKE